jgi:sarcosine oxidase
MRTRVLWFDQPLCPAVLPCRRGEVTTADSVDRSVSPTDEAALRACLHRYFPAADGRLARAAACLFTNTQDTNFILDRHPAFPQARKLLPRHATCSRRGFYFF